MPHAAQFAMVDEGLTLLQCSELGSCSLLEAGLLLATLHLAVTFGTRVHMRARDSYS